MKPSEAIANIEYARKWLGSESDFSDEALDMAISALKKQEQDRWIPVTERLPEDEYVLISKEPTKLSGSKWSVAIAIRTADPRSGKNPMER